MYSLLLAIIYLAFISLGLPDSLVGSGWPVMHADLGVPVSWAAFVTVTIAVGTILSSLASDRLTRRLGTGLVTAVSVGLTAAALLGFSVSTHFWMLLVWAVPYGLGAGAVDAALNNYVALHYAARHMNWLHCFWGVGASISPFIMGHAISDGAGWHAAYRTVGLLQVVLTVALLASLTLWGKVDGHRASTTPDEQQPVSGGHVPLGRALRIPGVWFVLVAFLAYIAMEGTAMLWASSYLVAQRGIDAATAATFGSLFVLGITFGRFLAGIFADRVGDVWLIRGGLLTVLVGVVLLGLPGLPGAVALVGLVVAGVGAAPVYPSIIHATPTNFGAENSQAIIGIQMAAAYTGSTIAPPLFGGLSSLVGMWVLPLFLGVMVVVGLVMSERLNRMSAA